MSGHGIERWILGQHGKSRKPSQLETILDTPIIDIWKLWFKRLFITVKTGLFLSATDRPSMMFVSGEIHCIELYFIVLGLTSGNDIV